MAKPPSPSSLLRPVSERNTIPVDPLPDSTLLFLRDGYDFVAKRCEKLASDVFRARMMLRPVVFARGEAAAEMFYDGDRFTRAGAMPASVLKLLQDEGSVQSLDAAAHRHRKAMFIAFLMQPGQVDRFASIFKEEWLAALEDWERQGTIQLFDAVNAVLTRSVLRWTGIPFEANDLPGLTNDLSSMIENAGRVGPRNWFARMRRNNTERFVRNKIEAIRRAEPGLPPEMPARIIAEHKNLDGTLLDLPVAAVELINVLRPVVAVGHFITFCAMALHEHAGWRDALRHGADETLPERFAEEVRRRYPFFPVVAGKVRQPFNWSGHQFRLGDWVILDLHGTDHDARLFPLPYDFDPDRDLSWREQGYRFIPQGAGDVTRTHRCPGEMITVRLMADAVRLLVNEMDYKVPPQDLSMPPDRIPALPAGGFRIASIRRRAVSPSA